MYKIRGLLPLGVAAVLLVVAGTSWASGVGNEGAKVCTPLSSIGQGVMNCDALVINRVRGQRGYNYTLQVVTEAGTSQIPVVNSRALLNVGRTYSLELRVSEGMVSEVKVSTKRVVDRPIEACGSLYRDYFTKQPHFINGVDSVPIDRSAEGYSSLQGADKLRVTIQVINGQRAVVKVSRTESCP